MKCSYNVDTHFVGIAYFECIKMKMTNLFAVPCVED